MSSSPPPGPTSYVDLYWLPLGAGGHVVRWNGRIYERLRALRAGGPVYALFHAALEVSHRGRRHVIEMAPVWSERTPDRGVQVEGPVGLRPLGALRAFRYEVRCWRDGRIPDRDEAVDSPRRVSEDPERAEHVLELVRRVPAYTWGRDELRCGDMWNSNSLVAWLLASTGEDGATVQPPAGGRAPGWQAGLALAGAGLS
ncbi:MAG: hypothetical protein WB797_13005, partial [Nocardioides sp.]